ncbi:carbohydrate ABC transporter permease [Eubacteriales bacterium OttesenSCG-928-K08]|nr:carbohydrate ABC transporter permease [Eubacteriales bacterium OttesenSCG-928-K08]
MKRKPFRKKAAQLMLELIAFVVVALFLFPYLYMVASAFKTRMDAFAYPPKWFFTPTLENFRIVLRDIRILDFMENSAVVAVFSVLLTLLIAVPATYALARYEFKGKTFIAYSFLFMQLLPAISIVFALFFVARQLNLYDTHFYLIVCNLLWNVPYAIWMLRGFVEGVPKSLEEAAIMDGCSRFGAFLRVTLPLISGGVAATAILVFIFVWNEFPLAFFLTSVNAKTLPTTIGFFMTHSGVQWGPMFAAATLGTLPSVVFVLLVRKYFVSALTLGAVKE